MKGGGDTESWEMEFLERESKPLLSQFPGDPTVGIRRDEKEKCSTHRDLHVGTGFGSFRQTP